ncbi:hypothetical protein AAK996_04700 [Streptococcus merionis]
MLLEAKAESTDWEKEKVQSENQVLVYRDSLFEANRRANNNNNYAKNAEYWFWIATVSTVMLLVLLLIMSWIHFNFM